MRALMQDVLTNLRLMIRVFNAPGEVMNASGAPRTPVRFRRRTKIDVRPGSSFAQSVAHPATFLSNFSEPHAIAQESERIFQIVLDEARGFQSTNLVFRRNRTLFPRRKGSG